VGLATGGYDAPMQGDLLWVYEGLTNYLGEVLAARSGSWSPQDYRDSLAMTAAQLDRESGRTWRPLEDTAVAAQLLYAAPDEYSDYRRSVDYYPEGSLIWLEADVTIRRLSHGTKSLNDFCRSFHGGPGGAPALKPYSFDDLVAALNAVQPYDWAGFFRTRLGSTEPHAPLGGISGGGWKLVYDGTPSDIWKASEHWGKQVDLSYSIGLRVKEDGTIKDVAWNGPAAKAGIIPSTKLIAVNGRQFDPAALREAVQLTATSTMPLELLIQSGQYYKTYRVDYRGGERYPHLERDEATTDLISLVAAPLAKK
jgi:predicted metalloprotease with PDZ domain